MPRPAVCIPHDHVLQAFIYHVCGNIAVAIPWVSLNFHRAGLTSISGAFAVPTFVSANDAMSGFIRKWIGVQAFQDNTLVSMFKVRVVRFRAIYLSDILFNPKHRPLSSSINCLTRSLAIGPARYDQFPQYDCGILFIFIRSSVAISRPSCPVYRMSSRNWATSRTGMRLSRLYRTKSWPLSSCTGNECTSRPNIPSRLQTSNQTLIR
jgi:hypothetical protein